MKSIFAKIITFLLGTGTWSPAQTPTPRAHTPTPSAPANTPVSPSEEYGTRVYHDQPVVMGPHGIPEKVEVAQDTKRGPRYFVRRFFAMTTFGEHTDIAGIGGQCQYPGCNGYGLKSRMDYCANCQLYFCPSHLKVLNDGAGEKKYCLICHRQVWSRLDTWAMMSRAEGQQKSSGGGQ